MSGYCLLAIGLSLASVVRFSQAVCPNANDIKPCTCDDEGLQCVKLNNSGLARVFSAPAERKAIRRVWIFQTNLTELPPRAFGDYIIRDLYLDLNQIARVAPGAFGEASKTLQSLSLTRNVLTEFPFEDLHSMKKLRQLGFGYNRFRRITNKAFPSSEMLESLDLSHNQLDELEEDAFSGLSEVSLIDLSRNNLRSLERNSLRVKSSQRHLAISLRGNQIDKIAVDAFGEHHPYSLDLSRNQLTYLEQSVFEPLLLNDTKIYVEGKLYLRFKIRPGRILVVELKSSKPDAHNQGIVIITNYQTIPAQMRSPPRQSFHLLGMRALQVACRVR
jgi:Leucine-rich repeat (LRR) protein